MRLVCPNCAAKYEVADNAIPTAGRNVQCANCENTWFQAHDSAAKPEANKPSGTDKRRERRNLRKKRQQSTESKELSPEQILDAEAALDGDQGDNQNDAPDDGPRAGIRYHDKVPSVDQSVLDILRQEAELDSAARQAEPPAEPEPDPAPTHEADPIPTPEPTPRPAAETAPDRAAGTDDLDAVAPTPEAPDETDVQEAQEEEDLAARAQATRARLKAKRKSELRRSPDAPIQAPAPIQEESAAPAPKRPDTETEVNRGALPDVNELNSTLRSASDKSRPAEESAPKPKRRRGGGRFGFYLAIVAALTAVAVYLFDDQIAERVPQAQDYLTAYVALVNQTRIWLDGVATDTMNAAKNLMDQYL